jgi:beta-glucosidase/6-phospho-beta-glucosidase/beta-galactosidase
MEFFSNLCNILIHPAAYQIEGAWNKDGKIPSIWDTVTHNNPGSILDRSTGDEAANSYELYAEDVKLLKGMNVSGKHLKCLLIKVDNSRWTFIVSQFHGRG